MKKIIIILFAISTFLCCKKKVIEGTYSIKGHIYNDCSKTPKKNYLLLLRDNYYENSRPKFVTYDTAYTDANGYFEFTYSNPSATGDMYITDGSGIYPGFINELPVTNLDSLEVLSSGRSSISAKLFTTNSYSNRDSLYIAGTGSNINRKIIGPFINGQILPTFNYNFSGGSYSEKYISSDFSFKINVNGVYRTITKKVYPCTTDTVTINLN